MAFADDVKAADKPYQLPQQRANVIARQHNLSIRTNSKTAKGSDWTSVLELDAEIKEYRIGFDVHLSRKFSKSGTARVWSLVQELSTGTWNQYIKENVPLAKLEVVINTGLTKFENWLKANDGLDPIDEARKQFGTAYYWDHNHDDGYYEYTTDFNDSEWVGTVVGSDGDFEAELSNPAEEIVFTGTGETVKELTLAVEKAYKKLNTKSK